eukprot:365980_1
MSLLIIFICIQNLLLISNSIESADIRKFWRNTPFIRVDGFGPHPNALFQTFKSDNTLYRSTRKYCSAIQNIIKHSRKINTTKLEFIHSWWWGQYNNYELVNSLLSAILPIQQILQQIASHSAMNYFVDLYYQNKNINGSTKCFFKWLFVTQYGNNEPKINLIKYHAANYFNVPGVHSLNATCDVNDYQALDRKISQRKKIDLENVEMWQALLNDRGNISNDEKRGRSVIEMNLTMKMRTAKNNLIRSLVNEERNNRLRYENETSHARAVLDLPQNLFNTFEKKWVHARREFAQRRIDDEIKARIGIHGDERRARIGIQNEKSDAETLMLKNFKDNLNHIYDRELQNKRIYDRELQNKRLKLLIIIPCIVFAVAGFIIYCKRKHVNSKESEQIETTPSESKPHLAPVFEWKSIVMTEGQEAAERRIEGELFQEATITGYV